METTTTPPVVPARSTRPARRLTIAWDWLVPLALAACFAVVLGRLATIQRWTLYHVDEGLAIYDQIIWNTAHGRVFASTLIEHARNMLGDHFAPAIAVFVPLYWIHPTPNWLLLGQAVALAAGIVPLYAFARVRLGAIAAVLVAVGYVAYPALQNVALYQFHEIALLIPPLALALLAIERGWRGWFLAAALACLIVKEEVAIVVVALGLLWWLRRRDGRMAIATVALGAVVGFLTMGVLLPALNDTSEVEGYFYVRRYAHLGATPLEMALTLVTRPDIVLPLLTATERLIYLAGLFGPLLLLPLIGWEYVVAAAPVFGYLLLSSSPDQYALDRHYLVPLVPFLFFGAVLGLSRLGRWRIGGAAAMALAAIASSYLLGPLPGAQGYDERAFTITPYTRELHRLVGQVPRDAPVAASRNLLSQFSQRERVYRFPVVGDADYVVLDYRELRHPAAFDGGALGRLMAAPEYRMADAGGETGAVLFVRGDPSAPPFTHDGPPTRLADQIDLLGYRLRPRLADDAVDVVLAWRALERPSVSYTAFVHVLDAAGNRIAQSDSPPVDGLMPTDTWVPGHTVVDIHSIRPAPKDAATLAFGLYDLRDGKRLPITARGLPGTADTVVVAFPKLN